MKRKAKATKRENSWIYALLAIIGIIGTILFLQTNLTGNVVGMGPKTSSAVSMMFFIIGIVGSFFWLKVRS